MTRFPLAGPLILLSAWLLMQAPRSEGPGGSPADHSRATIKWWSQVHAYDSALEDLGEAARDQRPPRPPPPIGDETPAGVRLSRQLRILSSAVERLAAQRPAQSDKHHAGRPYRSAR